MSKTFEQIEETLNAGEFAETNTRVQRARRHRELVRAEDRMRIAAGVLAAAHGAIITSRLRKGSDVQLDDTYMARQAVMAADALLAELEKKT